jgi:transcriptional antiterminator NusG
MPFFAAQIWTGSEEKFLTIARKAGLPAEIHLIWPRRNLRIRRGGIWKDSLAPIFPSYVFIRADAVEPALFTTLRRVPGFIRFLLSNENIVPMEKKDQELLTHFLSFGEVVDKSMVVFDEESRIRVLAGPLKGLEGRIVKVDRRKGRAKVKLEMYENSFNVDFGFEVLEKMPNKPRSSEKA